MTDLAAVQQLLVHERLGLDRCERGRTTFLSHVGAVPRLVPGPWLGHRDLIYALALANLSPAQRTSLTRAVLVDHGHEFGVGRLSLVTCPSGLPLGGTSVRFRPRKGGPSCLYTWALGPGAGAFACDWLLLRAQPGWALDAPPPVLRSNQLATLHALGLPTFVFAATPTCARQIADGGLADVPFTAFASYRPFVDRAQPRMPIRLWPHRFDPRALDADGPLALILVDAPESLQRRVRTWLSGQPKSRKIEVVHA
ncbi:MAG TPA: hypothetical protein VIK91_24745, partial [Nannocystis sp.]